MNQLLRVRGVILIHHPHDDIFHLHIHDPRDDAHDHDRKDDDEFRQERVANDLQELLLQEIFDSHISRGLR